MVGPYDCVHHSLLCRLVVTKIIPPTSCEDWCPLIVMANPSSGGKDGQAVLSSFRKLLNPIQVIDLSDLSPECGLEICRLLADHVCRILICGGDGTIGWVLAAIDQAKLPVSMCWKNGGKSKGCGRGVVAVGHMTQVTSPAELCVFALFAF